MASTNLNRNGLNHMRGNGDAAAPTLLQPEAAAAATTAQPELRPSLAGQIGATGGVVEVINSAELARRLGVPESWVRSRSNPKRTDDPIPHYKFGRYVQFPWGSEVLRAWLHRQLVSTDRTGHSRR
jgi:hypothetical protein